MDFLDYVKMCQQETEEPDMTRSGTMVANPSNNENFCRGMLYKVEKGDTLYSISRRYDLKVRDIMRANPFVNIYNLQIGEELCIPIAPGRPDMEARPYVVRQEDTLLSILKRNRISFEDLAALNRSVEVLKIPAGTILLIP